MKTVCLYFQVHQPWRLKKYRFFNMGKDHNYLDDLLPLHHAEGSTAGPPSA